MNPRGDLSPPTRLAGEHLRPLGQPSGGDEYTGAPEGTGGSVRGSGPGPRTCSPTAWGPSDRSCAASRPRNRRRSASAAMSRFRLQPPATRFCRPLNRSWRCATRSSGEWPCSAKWNVAPGFSTRRSSRSATRDVGDRAQRHRRERGVEARVRRVEARAVESGFVERHARRRDALRRELVRDARRFDGPQTGRPRAGGTER